MVEKLQSTELFMNVQISVESNVWPPYSAFYLAQTTFPIVKANLNGRNESKILCCDIGTGSGVLAILGGRYFPNSHWIITDLNPYSVLVARRNWILNSLPEERLTSLVADGIDNQLVNLSRQNGEKGGIDFLVANLPQQPLVDGEELEALRQVSASAWNVDSTRDPDGLGIFLNVGERLQEIMAPNGLVVLSVSSKQNTPRWKTFLDKLVERKSLKGWKIISQNKYKVPENYDPRFIKHWLSLTEEDKVPRLELGHDGKYYYIHYNLLLSF